MNARILHLINSVTSDSSIAEYLGVDRNPVARLRAGR